MHRAWLFLLSAAGRARRLSVHTNNLVTGIDQRRQNRHREIRAAHENDT